MGHKVHHSPSETSIIAPWNKMQLTENKPLGHLYNPVPRQANAQVSRLLRADHQDTATLVAYTDASVSGTTIHIALVCPSIPEACQTCSYFADPAPPAHLAELAAVRDGLAALIPFLIPDRCSQLIIRTDSTQAIHDIRRVYRSTPLSDSIHHLAASASVRIRSIRQPPPHIVDRHFRARFHSIDRLGAPPSNTEREVPEVSKLL
ncbi:hypothetical protein HPB52_013416 [Rhipicephalus sanguineus]|uniref:Uncharacterized protein n=1 Tax=Rhipicephalus sanguineus TaxID=34632 RepID=A0A9D4TA41_RHISA|nr:hypothetical protein HPB52_013416 [Rhipicephalus sanguineus]